jgi:hypothetical protein
MLQRPSAFLACAIAQATFFSDALTHGKPYHAYMEMYTVLTCNYLDRQERGARGYQMGWVYITLLLSLSHKQKPVEADLLWNTKMRRIDQLLYEKWGHLTISVLVCFHLSVSRMLGSHAYVYNACEPKTRDIMHAWTRAHTHYTHTHIVHSHLTERDLDTDLRHLVTFHGRVRHKVSYSLSPSLSLPLSLSLTHTRHFSYLLSRCTQRGPWAPIATPPPASSLRPHTLVA